VWITSSLDTVKTPTSTALGNFDGLHLGHRRVIEPVLPAHTSAKDLSALPSDKFLFYLSRWLGARSPQALSPTSDCSEAAIATVVTFSPHPQEFFTGQRRSLLTPLAEKTAILRGMGLEQLVLLPFTRELANLEPHTFVESILLDALQVQSVSIGQDFCFGRQRSGNASLLQAIAAPHGVQVHVIPLHRDGEERISSSAIRAALEAGNLNRANQLLGRHYTLIGEVVQGRQLGRTLGCPTANLKLPPEKFLPRQGVYAVLVHSPAWNQAAPVPGVMNIGLRPTVDGFQLTTEVHLLDWSGNLYGQTLVVGLEAFLRPERKFASLDALKEQIQLDCQQARSRLALPPGR
jgi:riboflavin kinase/FMN adenylyltransferase